MRTIFLYTTLALLLFFLSGCEAASVKAAALEPVTMSQLVAVSQPVLVEMTEDYRLYQTIFDAAVMDQALFRKYDDILVRWPDDMALKQEIALRIQRADGRIYGERITWVEAGAVINLGEAYVLPDGDFDVVLMPTPGVYYGEGLHIERRIPIQTQTRK